jgi:peroxiredoxin Q/BCP
LPTGPKRVEDKVGTGLTSPLMNTGDVVDDFELPDETGAKRRLSEFLTDGPVVLFFYPAALTSGCTRESCHFRDLGAEFKALGAQRVGISADGVDKQKQFSDKHTFDFPLLSDTERKVAGQFGVRRKIGFLPNKRQTFVIGTDRRLVGAIASETNMNTHADQALTLLRESASAT